MKSKKLVAMMIAGAACAAGSYFVGAKTAVDEVLENPDTFFKECRKRKGITHIEYNAADVKEDAKTEEEENVD